MAQIKVSALTAKTNTGGGEELLISDNGASKKVTIDNLLKDNGVLNKHIAASAVGTTEIADNAITSAKIGVDVIVAADLANNSITVAELSNNAVTTAKILDDNVTAAKLANSINTDIATGVTGNTTANAALPKAGGAMTGAITTNSTFDGVDIATRDGVLTSTTATAAAALPKAGGAMTGAITTNSTFDGRDVAADGVLATNAMPKSGGAFTGNITTNGLIDTRDVAADGVTADAALPKAGGTVTGNVIHNDNNKVLLGSDSDAEIYHTGSQLIIKDTSAEMKILATRVQFQNAAANENIASFNADGAVELYHNSGKKIETTAIGVTVTGSALGTMTTDNDGSFAMSASNNFKCTPAGNFALTFTAIVAQSGNILFINSGGHTISAHANTKVDATLLATISTAGTYLLAYFSDGTNVYMTNSAVYT